MLAKGDGAGDVRVPAPAPWVCSELAFRRALRWVESPEYGRRSLLHDSIVAGLAVSTCHDSRRGRLRALRGCVPGPRPSWQVHRPAAPPTSQARARSLANGTVAPRCGKSRKRAWASSPLLLSQPPRGHRFRFALRRERAADGGVPAHDTWVCSENAGRVRYLARHEAGPCESHGECYRSNHPRPNHVAMSLSLIHI